MSKENAKKFLGEVIKDEALQKELVLLAEKANLTFTCEELKEALAEAGIAALSEDELDKVSGGAYPTAVNNQITDSIT